MSVLSSVMISSPIGKVEECAEFVIEDTRERYHLYDVMAPDLEYTLSFWVKSESPGELIILDRVIETTSKWTRVVHTFTAHDITLTFNFGIVGTYYLYHSQLELGNFPTGWSLSPEDIERLAKDAQASADDAKNSVDDTKDLIAITEAKLEVLGDQIKSLVVDENGVSQMVQTADGWRFNLVDLKNSIKDASDDLNTRIDETKNTIDVLQGAVDDLGKVAEYIEIGIYEDEPCILLGEADSDFKLLITNTRIMFMDGGNNPTYISNDGLITENIDVKHELRQGNFVWAVRGNGNYGLMRKG